MSKIWIEVSDLGEQLAIARLLRQLTQLEAAKLLDMSPKTLQSIEQGQRGIGLPTLKALCKLYGIPWKNFLMGVDDPK